MKKVILKCRKVVAGVAEGEALVSKQAISYCGGVDPYTGNLIEIGHPLRWKNLTGKILVFPAGKGSSAWSQSAHASRVMGTNPKAMIIGEINPQTALGGLMMHIPVVTDLDQNPTEVIKTGDWVRVDADKGIVEVTEQ
jgi:hypothetical protein